VPKLGERSGGHEPVSNPITAPSLKRAIELAMRELGPSATEIVLYALRKHGISLNNPSSSYFLEKVEDAFNEVFGAEAGYLLLDKIKNELLNKRRR
jgi:hypothetical protein